jgi:formyl-CoA transferase/CoA:oxalate CoA-transferase
VLVENFRPGTLARLGLGYDDLRERFPRLIYCSISGFGQHGPRRDDPGYDAILQAEGGLMSITGPSDGPAYRLGVAVADIVTGLFAAQGITLALFARERTGAGQFVDIGMLDSVAALLTYQAAIYFATGSAPSRMGNRHPTIVPYETFAARDGDVVLAVGNDDLWRKFCAAAELDALADDPRFATNRDRVVNYDTLRPILAARLCERTRGEWLERLRAAGVPAGSVRDLHEVFTDPQMIERAMIAAVSHPSIGPLRLLGVPVKLSATPGDVRQAPPLLGEHTERVLTNDAGLDAAAIAALRSAGVI